ncbi:hypothetical protein [Abyssisolibacter fermentans]|uniref:hypothetical protein n=1 Tax=Abyssisolibacter fermentans TaxID=1766203 RepID=UPI0008343CCC|nr:hypothetical protein [Abyssisolibacter fermentans]
MFLKDLKQKMLLPKKEVFINKIVKIRGIDVQLTSITMEEHRNVLWAIYFDEKVDLEERTEYSSNRDEKINNINNKKRFSHINIAEMIIQKQKMTFYSSSTSRIYDMKYEGHMLLQHFIENGMDTTNWDEVSLADIVIVAYEQEKSEEFPTIDLSKELDITLKVSQDVKEVLINKPMCLDFNEVKKDNKFYFYDSIENKNRVFYIDEMQHYDIWEDVEHKFNERMKDFPKEQIKQLKEDYKDNLKDICPRGMNLALVEYEAEDDIQLKFYTKEYLEERPVHKSSSTMMLFKSDKNNGVNGFRSRICMIKPVEKDFNGSIDVELFSWYKVIPEEIILV